MKWIGSAACGVEFNTVFYAFYVAISCPRTFLSRHYKSFCSGLNETWLLCCSQFMTTQSCSSHTLFFASIEETCSVLILLNRKHMVLCLWFCRTIHWATFNIVESVTLYLRNICIDYITVVNRFIFGKLKMVLKAFLLCMLVCFFNGLNVCVFAISTNGNCQLESRRYICASVTKFPSRQDIPENTSVV